MHRFFISDFDVSGSFVHLSGKNAEHAKVLRLTKGEKIALCNGAGTDYLCVLKEISGDSFVFEIADFAVSEGEPNLYCSVFAAFPKSGKAEEIVQKSVELGASAIAFFSSARCVSKPGITEAKKKIERFQKIAEEAAKQCGRGIIPSVCAYSSFPQAVSEAAKSDLALFLYEEEREVPIKKPLIEKSGFIKRVSVMTGPEGGFEQSEADFARNSAMLSVSLGKRILRCETAPVAALTAVMLLTDNLE